MTKCVCGKFPYNDGASRNVIGRTESQKWSASRLLMPIDDGGRRQVKGDSYINHGVRLSRQHRRRGGAMPRFDQVMMNPSPSSSAVDLELSQRIVQRAHKEISDMSVERNPLKGPVALVELDEIRLGRLLGTGGFSSCHEITSVQLATSSNREGTHYTSEQQAARLALAAKDAESCACPFALKYLRPSLAIRPKKFANGAIDLTLEGHLLSTLSHPHIIDVHAVASNGPDGYATGRHDGYFIIMDRLQETLVDRIHAWRKQMARNRRNALLLACRPNKGEDELLLERLEAAHNIASAMDHLHNQNLIYRDLKPGNCGFALDGRIRIFDFGLARELPKGGRGDANETFAMTGNIGTSRYMAPEVAQRLPYNTKADVFSFGILLYELLWLNEAFYDSDYKDSTVRTNSIDPPLDTCPCWSEPMQDLVEHLCSADPINRPTMAEACTVLQATISELKSALTEGRRWRHHSRRWQRAAKLGSYNNNKRYPNNQTLSGEMGLGLMMSFDGNSSSMTGAMSNQKASNLKSTTAIAQAPTPLSNTIAGHTTSTAAPATEAITPAIRRKSVEQTAVSQSYAKRASRTRNTSLAVTKIIDWFRPRTVDDTNLILDAIKDSNRQFHGMSHEEANTVEMNSAATPPWGL